MPVSAEGERRDETASVGKTAGCEHRDGDLLGCGGDQHETRDVVLTGVAGAFEAVDADAIDTRVLWP